MTDCVKLNEIGTIYSGGTPRTSVTKYWDGNIVWVTPKDLSEVTSVSIIDSTRKLTKLGLKESSAQLIPAGSVVLSSRAPIGYVAIVDVDFATNQGCKSIKPVASIYNRYVYYYLKSQTKELNQRGSGTTFLELSKAAFSNFEIPICPLLEQKRIVAKIESLFSRLDSAKDSLERVRQEIKRYRQSVLKSAFEGKLTGSVKFEIKKICDVGEVITGNTPSKRRKDYYGGDVNFFKPTDLNAGILMYGSREKLSKLGLEEGRFAKAGSVLVTCIGATIGKTAFMNEDGAFNQQINAVIPQKEISGKYLYYFFISKGFQDALIEGASSTTMPIINKTRFENLIVSICDLKQQIKIVESIESRFERSKTLEEAVEQGITKIEQLKQSILKKAFEGKLVEPDPNDEPVELLLERIQKEKNKINF
ncbi:MAG: restriction endonuclease subunit S [Candidatus Omnitrophica bacterium]|nr:restriction endonuclease subunit S [Candidatus Omnitrophota bacterium]